MFASTLATMTSLQMVFFSEDDEASGTVIEIFWIEIVQCFRLCAKVRKVDGVSK